MNLSKHNTKTKLTSLSVIVLLLMTVVSCRDRMAGLNKNLKGVTSSDLLVDANGGKAMLPDQEANIIDNVTWKYQLQRNLNSDIFSGYMMTPTIYQPGQKQNPSYAIVDGYTNQIWSTPVTALNAWLTMKNKGYDKQYPDLYGIALICKVFTASLAAENFGPLPYSKYGNSSTVPFDSPEIMYDAFFSDLDTAVKNLTKKEDENPNADQVRFAPVDKSNYGGDYTKWIKVANTLRLRLAIHISLVAPDKAQKEAEKAVSQKYGVLEKGDGSFVINTPGTNSLYVISNSWKNIRLGAPVSTILGGYNDPRLPVYAKKATDPALSGDSDGYKGIREGIDLIKSQKYVGYSGLNIPQSAPIKLMDVSESYFLRAEGALRGWDMGSDIQGSSTAQGFYEDGMRTSFAANGLSASQTNDYLSNNSLTQSNYVDPLNSANNAPTLNNVTVKWTGPPNGAGHKIEDLKKIIIQKWIANFPEGNEAWTEFRRTGYPKLYPVKLNNSGGVIPDGDFIKRLPYTSVFTNASQKQVSEAVSKYLNDQNNTNQALWWDIENGPKGWVNQ